MRAAGVLREYSGDTAGELRVRDAGTFGVLRDGRVDTSGVLRNGAETLLHGVLREGCGVLRE